MNPEHDDAAAALGTLRRSASVATVGGFRPPDDPFTSWIIRGCLLPGEGLPKWKGTELFPLLQVRIDELPVVPPALQEVAMLVVYMNHSTIPFDKPHGEGWLVREYPTLYGLISQPVSDLPFRPFPLSWKAVDDMPGWEDADELLDGIPMEVGGVARDISSYDFYPHNGIKFGGYPVPLQHSAGLEDFVFQIDSDAKSGWNWAGDGVAYFHRTSEDGWRFSCQMT
jgi:hypothetical protein